MLRNSTLVGFLFLVVSQVFAQTTTTPTSSAAMTLTSYSSNFYTVTTGTTPTIYVGMTSNNSKCTGAGCNSCAAMSNSVTSDTTPNFTACSLNEIHPADAFSFSIQTTTAIGPSPAQVLIQMGSSSSSFTSIATNFTGANATYSVPWSTLCNLAASDSSCTTSFNTTLTIGWNESSTTSATEQVQVNIVFRYVADSPAFATWGCAGVATYEGFCSFTGYPGDSKIYIFPQANTAANYVVPDLNTSGGTGSSSDPSNMTYSGLAVFYSKSNAASSFTPSTPMKILALSIANGSLTPKFVDGLSNGTTYYLSIASVDQAGILTYFSQPTSETLTTTPFGQTQAATPEPVKGLLNGQSCFIATAAYGSAMAPEVETFRQFRGQYLLNSEAGQWFVRTYYKLSPPLANFISKHESLRSMARVVLLPLLVFVKVCLQLGLIATLGLMFLLTGFIFVLQLRLRKQVEHKA